VLTLLPLFWLMSGTYQVGQAELGVVQRFGAFAGLKSGGLAHTLAHRDRHQG
jgi:regulator of protease activity HflC (stomatin/prohibitin superfamily)